VDAFISWTGADRDVKNLLVEKLQAAGISCWDSDEECTSDYSAECIAAIKRCGLFIVIVSNASMEKGYVLNEVITARNLENEGKLNILVYKITDAPYSDAFNFQLNHISMVTGNFIQRQESSGGLSGLDQIVARATKLLNARKSGMPEKPFDVHIPRIEGLAITKTGYFVENSRDTVLDTMAQAFSQSNVLVIREFFGFGKRSTIRKYVELHKEEIKAAVFVSNTQGDLRSFLLADLHFSNLNPTVFSTLEGDALLNAKLGFLEKLDASHLLVISDVDCNRLPDEALCQRLLGMKCRIILLTQDSADGYEDWFSVIRVGRMENSYLTELFFHHYTRAFDEEKEALYAPLEQFFDSIGGHTKTVELTASVLNRDMGVLPEELPGYLSSDSDEGQALQDRILDQISHVFDIEQLSPEQCSALLMAACLAVPYLPERTYRQLLRDCGVTDYRTIVELDERRWLDLDPGNQTVSMEPLVAQVVFRKFADNYPVLQTCLTYLEDAVSHALLAATNTTYIRNLCRTEHFFRLTGMTLPAQLIGQLRTFYADENAIDYEAITQLVQQFDQDYPSEKFAELADEELPADLQFGFNLIAFCKRAFVPILKMLSGKTGHLLFGTAGVTLTSQPTEQILVAEEMFGISKDVLEEWRLSLQAQIDAGDELDNDDQEFVILLKATKILDGILNQRIKNVYEELTGLFDYLFEYPHLLHIPDMSNMLYAVVSGISTIYINNGAYGAAIMLCEQTFQLCEDIPPSPVLLSMYIKALRCSQLYNDTLFDSYQALLDCYEMGGNKLLEDRQDTLVQKNKVLLQYAYDLALSGQPEPAEEAFAKARATETAALLEDAILTLYEITQAQIKAGNFPAALAFLKQHFTEAMAKKAAASSDDDVQKNALELLSILQFDPAAVEAEPAPAVYQSYYQEFSRKNNALTDRKYFTVADRVADFDFSHLTNEQLAVHTQSLRERAAGKSILQLAPEAFALASEAGYRVLGYRHHYVQYMAAAAMADGKITEVLNGEGKTYTIVLTAFLYSLYGSKVFVVDESAYLTERNFTWMQGVYALLGVSATQAKDSSILSENQASVCYVRLKDLMLSYVAEELHSNNRDTIRLDCVIIDEADMVLVDEASQQYAFSRPEEDKTTPVWCQMVWDLLGKIETRKDMYICRNQQVLLSPGIYPVLERHFHLEWGNLENIRQTHRIEGLVKDAILAKHIYQEGTDYFIHNGLPVFEQKEKGTFSAFRTEFEYFLCRRHGLDTTQTEKNLAVNVKMRNLISIRDLFRKCGCVCGTTATAVSFRKEFKEIYDLDYVPVPPHAPCIRQEHPAALYISLNAKLQSIVSLVAEKHKTGQPILLCTQSVKESELYDRLLTQVGIDHKLLNARNAEDAAGIIAFAGVPGAVLVANALTGRGADIKLGGNPERMTRRELIEMGVDITGLDTMLYTLPTPEITQSDLYKRYFSILEKNRLLCARDKQTVLAAGGLCVIITSFFPEARNEQQAIGRAGRQGEPGESYVFQSLDDEWLLLFFSTAYLEQLRAACGDDLAFDSKMLRMAVRNAQKQLHDRAFSRIRNLNNLSASLDAARSDFIGRRFALLENPALTEAHLKQWAADKQILKQLQALQQGADTCESTALFRLWNSFDVLKQAKGLRASRILANTLLELLDHLGEENQHTLRLCQDDKILDNWSQYIQLANDLTNSTNLADSFVKKQLAEEKRRLLLDLMEPVILMLLHYWTASA